MGGHVVERERGLLERLSRIQRSISHGAPLEEVFAAIAAGAAQLLGDPVCGLRLVDEDDPTTMRLVACTGLTPEQLEQVRVGVVGEGAGGRAIAEGRVVVVEDYPDTSDGIARFGEFGVQNALAAPVRVGGRVAGSLTVATYEAGRRYDTFEQEMLGALAEHAGMALLDVSLIDQRERTVQRRGEERFQALVRHSSDLIAIVDADGVIAWATPSVGRVLGLRGEELPGSSLLAHVHPGDRATAALLLQAAAVAPGTRPATDWRLVPAGTQFEPRRWMHVEVLATNLVDHPAVGGIVINARDVTERVIAEQQRREQDALYRLIVDTTHDGVWMTDPQDRTVFVNDALAKMLGRRPDEILGRRPVEFMPADQTGVVAAALARRRHGDSDRYEATFERADGTPIHLQVSGTPIFEGERFAGSLALCGDVTELRQAQELGMLGRLAGHVAHDFNQVLAVVRGYAELLAVRLADDERTREDLAHVIEAAEHGAALSRQLVTFSRGGAGEPEVLDLAAVTRATAALIEPRAPASVTIACRADEPLPVRIDPTKLRQILMNLAENALHALDGGGTLELTARAAGAFAELCVRDTGAGMPADVVARALEPAFTTKATGTGLGLAIVQGAVEAAGGRLELDSQLGEGTTVTVLLPRSAATGSAATILLVDDDVTVLELTRRVLAEHGYEVLAASGPAAALRAAREHDIDLLLTDQTMPEGTGLELAAKVCELRPGTPVVVMSGYGGAGRLVKPFGAADLIDSVRAALSRP